MNKNHSPSFNQNQSKLKISLSACCLMATLFLVGQTPKFEWAKQMGGAGPEGATSIALDASGNIYTAGFFNATCDFDPGPGTFNLTPFSGFSDIFISKSDASGNFVWARQFGGTMPDGAIGLAVDAAGNIFTTGYFSETADFDAGPGTNNLIAAGRRDIFISKSDFFGNFVWARQISGTLDELGYSIALDGLGNIYTTGMFQGTVDFDPGSGIFNLTAADSFEIFISKLDASGNFVWARQLGGPSNDIGHSIAVDAVGNVFTTGYFRGTVDFDTGPGTSILSATGREDIFISKTDAFGNLIWVKNMGGTLGEVGLSIAADLSGNVYATGYFSGTPDFDPGAGKLNLTTSGSNDIFISKLDASGNFEWAKKMGGSSGDQGNSVAVDKGGNVYTTGYYNKTADFDPGPGQFNLTTAGEHDIFISKLDASGNFLWAGSIGGPSIDIPQSIKLDGSGNIYITGSFWGTVDFEPGPGTSNMTSAGFSDIFIHKMSQKINGIDQKVTTNKIILYPNPTDGILNLRAGIINDTKLKIQVLNFTGQLLFVESDLTADSSINIKHFPPGLYFVKVMSDNEVIALQRIVRQ